TRFKFHDGVVSCRVQRVLNVGFGKESTEWIALSKLYSPKVDPDTLHIFELARWIKENYNFCERANFTHKQIDEIYLSQNDKTPREDKISENFILKSKMQEIEQQLKDRTSECVDLKNCISDLETSLAQADKDVMAERKSRSSLEMALSDATAKIEMLESELRSHPSINGSLERENSELKQRCVQLESRIEELKSKIVTDAINAIYEKKKESITAEIESITGIKKKLMDEIEKLKTEIIALKENKSNLLFELDKSIEEKKKKISEMSTNPRVRVKFELVYDETEQWGQNKPYRKEKRDIKYFEMRRNEFLLLRGQSQLTILNFAVANIDAIQDETVEYYGDHTGKRKFTLKKAEISEVCTLFDLESEN
ncbi:MAG: hypothetical protein NC453_23075, partial [Muribaculum sp.]|nr:hypothetical protein [Muribaculum sp.]